ncbi:Transcription initiation factor TFIID subunit 1 [Vitis vinifera]|uniref:Transcription initiation factor TFIID subunit 1 n=1 Tax=Vitis vinifera TaxID=29760 RepID=A0A438JK74_VITVI|nr:Transcription initiation factor TFIID subunit 1 [Vitis vinifera]
MGFEGKWIGRIMWCIPIAKFSVLVNETLSGFFPSSEGLRQGDPLSPYLFMIAMMASQDHITYLCWLLMWFEAISRWVVYLPLIPLGAPLKSMELSQAGMDWVQSNNICDMMVISFKCFGNSNRGGRTLDHKPHLVKWTVVCGDKKKGGLGVKNLSVLNKALLCKWSWRFAIERGAFWNQVIHSKYGEAREGWATQEKVCRDVEDTLIWSVAKSGKFTVKSLYNILEPDVGGSFPVLLKFNVPEELIAKQTRWHRIAMIRKLSSEQAASGVKVDPTTISKYARGQRMSFLQLQQQTREKCQEIWDRQVQSLSAVDSDEIESDSEANSDLDSFAGDLENLLDAEECEDGEEGNCESKHDRTDGVRGLKMRRRPSQAQAEEEIEDEAAEQRSCVGCSWMVWAVFDIDNCSADDEAERKKKKKTRPVGEEEGLALGSQLNFGFENGQKLKKNSAVVKQLVSKVQPDGSYSQKEKAFRDSKEVESFLPKRNISGKAKILKKNDTARMGVLHKKIKIMGDGIKMFKEKKSARESFVCGACGQLGHMRTNKNCPKYGEDLEAQVEITEPEKASVKSSSLEHSAQLQQRTLIKKIIPKSATKMALVETSEGEKSSLKAKNLPVKFKCGSADRLPDKVAPGTTHGPDQRVISDAETGNKFVKVNKIIISNKMKPEDSQVESHKPSIVIRPPTETDKEHVESHKPSIVIRPPSEIDRDQVESHKPSNVTRPPTETDRDQVESHKPSIVIRPPVDTDRDQPRKKIIIKRPKEISLDQVSQDGSTGLEYRKTKKIVELSSFEKHKKPETKHLNEDAAKRKAREDKRLWEEEEKRRNAERLREERAKRLYEEEMRMLEEQERLAEIRKFEEAIRREREEEERQKARKKKKKKMPEMRDNHLEDYRTRRNDRRIPERDRSTKRRPVVELGKFGADYGPPTKRRRGGEVGLSNVLESIVDSLRDRYEDPMDLSTIREKVRKMEYKSREDFRHDVWQITYNAHIYNDGRNPGIPPLADQLLELCDYLLSENDASLTEAEAGIEYRDT